MSAARGKRGEETGPPCLGRGSLLPPAALGPGGAAPGVPRLPVACGVHCGLPSSEPGGSGWAGVPVSQTSTCMTAGVRAVAAQPGHPQDILDKERGIWCCAVGPHVSLVEGWVPPFQFVCCPHVHWLLPALSCLTIRSWLLCKWLELARGAPQQKHKEQLSPSHPKTEFISTSVLHVHLEAVCKAFLL